MTSSRQGLQILVNLDHRGAVGADPLVGDGAGCLIQIPDALLRDWARKAGVDLPPPGHYAVAMCFLPQDEAARQFAVKRLEHFIKVEGQKLIGWRDVPIDTTGLGKAVIERMPVIRQAIVGRGAKLADQDAFERKLLAIRKQTQNPLVDLDEEAQAARPGAALHAVLLDAHRGLQGPAAGAAGRQLLRGPAQPADRVGARLVHQRFSTNTFPSWRLAHPYRFIAHNGEINTVRGNVNWMNARRRTMESELLGADLDKMWPLIPHGQSDTACLDNALELLVAGGYSLAHAMMMLIPEAWAGNPLMDAKRRAFYEYHAALMEPWDGPAAIAFTDGRQIGATLDRNGLRPARFIVTDDDHGHHGVGSRACCRFPRSKIVRKWRLQPGKMLLIDLEQGRIVEDEEIKRSLAEAEPYEEWLKQTQFKLEELSDLPDAPVPAPSNDPTTLLDRQQAFGYTQEDLQLLPRADERGAGDDPIGSMGTDTPIAVLSQEAQAALQLLQAELRAGHQPADRSDPRGAGDVAGLDDRPAAQPARPAGRHAQAAGSRAADPDQCRPGEDPLDRGAARRRLPHRDASTPPGRPPRAPPGWSRRSTGSAARRPTRAGRPQHPDPVGSRRVGRARRRSRRCWRPRRCTIT